MSYDKANVRGVLWLTPRMQKTFGIVFYFNGIESRCYIKEVAGMDEDFDIKDIAENGARLHKQQLQNLYVLGTVVFQADEMD